jgi:asparagine synthase (glutamine-hydrolysing)
MCGIVGWIDWERELAGESETLAAMVKTLEARGPDAAGTYMNGHVALGHRRLSVIDLEGGKQPMLRERGGYNYVITYNGELYNTSELKQELQARGHNFSTASDTEVLLKSYIEWGPACTERLNGIFAFGIWDEEAQQIFLARDRIGVKPLFYTEQNKALLFASELKALLANPLVRPQIDQEGLSEVFMIGPARTPGHGIYRGVKELKPGYSMIYSRNGLKIRQYWALESKPHTDDFKTTAAKVRELLVDTVNRQLVSDVPVCTLLSGGLDSSALTALAWASYIQDAKKHVETYSVDYVDNDIYFKANKFQPNSDTSWIKKVSQCFATKHHNVILDTPVAMIWFLNS